MTDLGNTEVLNFDQPKKISSFLNVLTILTFIGSTLGALASLAMPMGCKMIGQLEGMAAVPQKQADLLAKICANSTLFIANALIGAILCIIGAIMMRKLKKTGYFIYIAGVFIPIIISLVVFGSDSLFIDAKSAVTTVIGGLLFPVLYALNLKDMK